MRLTVTVSSPPPPATEKKVPISVELTPTFRPDAAAVPFRLTNPPTFTPTSTTRSTPAWAVAYVSPPATVAPRRVRALAPAHVTVPGGQKGHQEPGGSDRPPVEQVRMADDLDGRLPAPEGVRTLQPCDSHR